MQKHWIVWFPLCKDRLKNCFLFLVLAKMWQPARGRKKTWATWCGVGVSKQQVPPPHPFWPSCTQGDAFIHVNSHRLPSSKQSTGLTFNYKINMDFLINNQSICVYKNRLSKFPLTFTEFQAFLPSLFTDKNLLLLREKKIDLVSHMELTNKK